MTPAEFAAKPAIDHLRLMVRNFGNCNESFNQRFQAADLFALHKAWMLSGWDFYPDTWTARQIAEALKGKPPQWDHDELPVYA